MGHILFSSFILHPSSFLSQVQQTQTTTSTGNNSMLGWVLGFVIAFGVLALVARPLMVMEGGLKRRIKAEQALEEGKLESLYERAAAERKSLEELEFDHELGNLEEADYQALKQKNESALINLENQIHEYQDTAVKQEQQRQAKVATKRESKATTPAPVKAEASAKPAATKTSRATRLVEMEGRLKPAVKEAMKCSECAQPFKPGDRFCVKCGAPLPHICLHCGAELKQDERFCAKCGAAVVD